MILHTKKLFIGALISLSVMIMIGCGETTTPEKVDPDKVSQQTEAQKPKPPEIFSVGEQIKMGDLAFIVNSVRTSKGDEFFKPKENYIYKIIDVTLENLGKESESISSLLMFSVSDSEGYSYDTTIGPETKGSVDGELQPSRKLRGEIAFEIPVDATGLELLFEPNLFGFGQAIIKI
jgi:hypothetical protein